MFYTLSKETIRANLNERLEEYEAELKALKAVKVNTKHKVLTNRAIEGATVFNYLDINKAIRVPYVVETDTRRSYKSREITVYSYNDENGQEIGSEGFLRISRTLTPSEVKVVIDDIIEGLKDEIAKLKNEYRRADKIADKHNKLAEQVNKFNDSISYASQAHIK